MPAFAVLGQGCLQRGGVYDHPGVDLPVYEDAAPEAVLAAMQERDAGLTSWRAVGTVLLSREGRTTRLDGIMLIDALETESPRLRLRASKLGRNAIDLVYADGEAWVWTRSRADDAGGDATDAAPIELPLALIRSESLVFDRSADDHLVFNTTDLIGEHPAEVWVHRSTRTTHRVLVQSPDGPVTTELRYRSGEPAPHVDALRLSLGGEPVVEFLVDAFQPNPSLTPAHFKPVPGSRRLGLATRLSLAFGPD
ncbi:MAG: hypothetical protein AAF750_00515 [Planctomycetota bacterium]